MVSSNVLLLFISVFHNIVCVLVIMIAWNGQIENDIKRKFKQIKLTMTLDTISIIIRFLSLPLSVSFSITHSSWTIHLYWPFIYFISLLDAQVSYFIFEVCIFIDTSFVIIFPTEWNYFPGQRNCLERLILDFHGILIL